MNKYNLSFGSLTVLDKCLAELIINNEVVITLEMVEELDVMLQSIFKHNFGLLVNKLNTYSYTYEAKLVLGSIEHMKAIASVYYTTQGREVSLDIVQKRNIDGLNVRVFSGFELGRQQALDWLTYELTKQKTT